MRYFAIDNLRGDILIGIGVGALMIFLNVLGLFSFALPPVLSLSTGTARFMVVVLIAPIIEEIFFRMFLNGLLINRLRVYKYLAFGIQGIIFGLFHLSAYAGVTIESFSLSSFLIVGGAFLSAILYGFLISLLLNRTNNLLTSIIPHAMINFWLVKSLLVIVG